MLATEGHAVWSEISPELQPHDFRHPHRMDVEFLRLLSKIRRAAGVPFRVVSDYRDPNSNPGAAKSAHMEEPCKAVDLRVLDNRERWRVVSEAVKHGIVRIGVYAPNAHQAEAFGKASGSVHLDASAANPQERIWMTW